MLFLFISDVYLSSFGNTNRFIDYKNLSGDFPVLFSFDKFTTQHEIISVESYKEGEKLESLLISGHKEYLNHKKNLLDNNTEIKRIIMKREILGGSNGPQTNENNLIEVFLFVENINELIEKLNKEIPEYLDDEFCIMTLKQTLVFYNAFQSKFNDANITDLTNSEISIEILKQTFLKVFERFQKDFELFKDNKHEEIVLKKTFSNTLNAILRTINIFSDYDEGDSILYVFNKRSVVNDLTYMSITAFYNLYFFANKYDEIKLIN